MEVFLLNFVQSKVPPFYILPSQKVHFSLNPKTIFVHHKTRNFALAVTKAILWLPSSQ
jgi:hypothetical protein